MKIVHACSTSATSGANRYAFDLAAGQAALGHSVAVCIPEKPGDSLEFAQPGVSVLTYGAPKFWTMNRAIAAEQPDIIHCHGGMSSRWLRYMPRRRAAAVITIHSVYKPKYMSHFDGLHYLADWQADMVAAFPGIRRKINNWIPNLAPSTPESVGTARAAAGAGDEDFLVGFLGRLHPVKGAADLLEAFLATHDKKLKLAIVGDGPERQRLEAMAASDARIRFMGHSDRPADWYNAVDLLVMPSHHEPFALVALEAMSLGTPLVTSDLQGFQEILNDRPDCRLDTTDPAALGQKIDALAARKTTAGITRDTYDLNRFDRLSGIRTVTRFYDDVIAAKAGKTAHLKVVA